jgi:3-hydroxyacyl-CoA dehydrogenase/enoyl-CoA hydratase/3-hydroxybutyryl-CoA epimerase
MSREARLCLEEGIAETADDIDLAMVLGTGYAPFRGGPMQYALDVASRQKGTPNPDNPKSHESGTRSPSLST